MRSFLLFLASWTLCAVITGCSAETEQPPATPPDSSSIQKTAHDERAEKPVQCIIAIDGSGSYEHLDRAKYLSRREISGLPGGSMVMARWITDQSNADQASIVSAKLPAVPEKPENVFSPKKQERYRRQVLRGRAIRKQIFERLHRASSPEAEYTDIWGALYAAAERFRNTAEYRPRLVLMTDMVDNVGRRFEELDLAGVDIRVYYQSDPESGTNKATWERKLKELGAADVRFIYMDEVVSFAN